MNEENVGSRFGKALELKYGEVNNPLIAKKYQYTQQTIGQAKTKKAINETISFICEKENINLNWIQTGKGEIFIDESNSHFLQNEENIYINKSFQEEIINDIQKLSPKRQEYYYHRIKADLIEEELNKRNI